MAKRWKTPVIVSRTPEQVHIEINAMPQFEVDRMCRTIIGGANRFFENPEVRKDFAAWKAARTEAAKA